MMVRNKLSILAISENFIFLLESVASSQQTERKILYYRDST